MHLIPPCWFTHNFILHRESMDQAGLGYRALSAFGCKRNIRVDRFHCLKGFFKSTQYANIVIRPSWIQILKLDFLDTLWLFFTIAIQRPGVYMIFKGSPRKGSETGEFSENFQTAFNISPLFQKNIFFECTAQPSLSYANRASQLSLIEWRPQNIVTVASLSTDWVPRKFCK